MVRGDALLLPRAIAIYKAALCQNYIEVLECNTSLKKYQSAKRP